MCWCVCDVRRAVAGYREGLETVMEYIVGAVLGFTVGASVVWLAARSVIRDLRQQIAPFDGDGDGRIGGSKGR